MGPADFDCLWEDDRTTVKVVHTQANGPKLTETLAKRTRSKARSRGPITEALPITRPAR